MNLPSGSSALGAASHESVALTNAAVDEASPASPSSDDWSTLTRNGYITMGLLGGVVLVLIAILVVLMRDRRAKREGYNALGR